MHYKIYQIILVNKVTLLKALFKVKKKIIESVVGPQT